MPTPFIFFLYSDASIKQTTIALTFSMSIKGITGYKFTLGIPFSGYVNALSASWIGIVVQRSIYNIYGFYAQSIKGGGLCDEGFTIINNMNATIFYLK